MRVFTKVAVVGKDVRTKGGDKPRAGWPRGQEESEASKITWRSYLEK